MLNLNYDVPRKSYLLLSNTRRHLLAGSIAVVLISVGPNVMGEGPNHPGPLEPYFNAGCTLHGVDDYLLNQSYFFCIDKNGGKWTYFAGRADYEGLDYNPHLGLLFASAGDNTRNKGNILAMEPLPNCEVAPLAELGSVTVKDGRTMEEVDGIAFDDAGNMMGWAQESGMFWVSSDNIQNIPLSGNLVIDQPAEVEDIEFYNDCVIGLLNVDHWGQAEDGDDEQHPNHPVSPEDVSAAIDEDGILKASYMVACLNEENGHYEVTRPTPCEQEVAAALDQYNAAEIEAIEILPPVPGVPQSKVLLGFHTNSQYLPLTHGELPGDGYVTLVLGILDVNNCTLQTQEVYDIPQRDEEEGIDVEGLAMVCP
jgi:hypothetical protein